MSAQTFISGKSPCNPDTIEASEFELNSVNERGIAACLNEANFDGTTPRKLLDYVASSIAYREDAKFAFSRGLSDALAVLCSWGEAHGLTREDISFLALDDIFDHDGDASRLTEISRENREAHRLARAIRLPGVIADPDDIDVVRLMHGQPTYVTNKSITSPLRCKKSLWIKGGRPDAPGPGGGRCPNRARRPGLRLAIFARDSRPYYQIRRCELTHGNSLRRIRCLRRSAAATTTITRNYCHVRR